MLQRKKSCFLCQAFFFLVGNRCRRLCVFRSCFVCLSQERGNSFLSDISTEPSCLPPPVFILFSIQCSGEKPFKNSNVKGFPYKEKCDTKMADFAFVFRLGLLLWGIGARRPPLFSLESRFHFFPAVNRMTRREN